MAKTDNSPGAGMMTGVNVIHITDFGTIQKVDVVDPAGALYSVICQIDALSALVEGARALIDQIGESYEATAAIKRSLGRVDGLLRIGSERLDIALAELEAADEVIVQRLAA